MLLPGRCPVHRAAALPPAPRAAGPRMRETPGTAALQTLLRHLHPGLAGCSRAASGEEHMCACSTALWTHIRSLMHKGKVGLRGGRGPWGGQGPGSVPPTLSPCWLCWSQFWKGRDGEKGPGVTSLWREAERLFSCCSISPFKAARGGRPWWPSGSDATLPLQRARLRS